MLLPNNYGIRISNIVTPLFKREQAKYNDPKEPITNIIYLGNIMGPLIKQIETILYEVNKMVNEKLNRIKLKSSIIALKVP